MISIPLQPSLTTSLHNHTVWSDGRNSAEEMILSAREKGLARFGISDHWALDPTPDFDSSDYAMPVDALPQYIEELRALKEKYSDDAFSVLIGLEVDYFPQNLGEIRQRLRDYPFDYLIGSSHYVGTFSTDNDPADWAPLTQSDVDAVWAQYWENLFDMAQSGIFTFLGHLDLPKKYDHYPTADFSQRILDVLDAARASGTAIELNTSGWFKPCAEQYPDDTILREAIRRGIPIVISADAHDASCVNRAFPRAMELLSVCSSPRI